MRPDICYLKGMRAYPVYCKSPVDGTVVRVGSIMEMRKSRRSMNRISLAKLAQKIFSRYPGDVVYIGQRSVLEHAESIHESALSASAG